MKFFLLLVLFFAYEVSSKVLPDYIPQCKRSDPEFVKCILAAIDQVRPYLAKGIPEIRVPSLEPLEIPNLSIDRNLEALTVKAALDKMKVYGGSAFKVKNMKFDLDKYTAELLINLPLLRVTSKYDVAGRLLLIPLAGKGRLEGNFTDVSAFVKGAAKVIQKKGISYLQVEKLESRIKIGDGHVKFVDKDGSNALIAETVANFFNGNPKLVLEIIKPIVEDTTNSILVSLVNRMFRAIPLNELLLED